MIEPNRKRKPREWWLVVDEISRIIIPDGKTGPCTEWHNMRDARRVKKEIESTNDLDRLTIIKVREVLK